MKKKEVEKIRSLEVKKMNKITNPNGSHGLHQDSFKLQIMTAFNEKILRMLHGSRGWRIINEKL